MDVTVSAAEVHGSLLGGFFVAVRRMNQFQLVEAAGARWNLQAAERRH